MPRPGNLVETSISLRGGYYPSVPELAPEEFQSTINAGSNVWVRPGGKLEVAKGLLETSSNNVGARLFAADTQRASIEGGLVDDERLPYASLLRYQNNVLLFLSEYTDAQVYLDETEAPDVFTSSTAGRLRVAVPDDDGNYTTFDAGFEKPDISGGFVTNFPGLGQKNMTGFIGVALARWRSKTNAWGPPSEVIYQNLTANTNTVIDMVLPPEVAGQDGWLVLGTRWGDRSGQLRIVRYLYIFPRGTFTTENGSVNIVGENTFWTQDLQVGDLIDIGGTTYVITTLADDSHATLDVPFAALSGPGKTMKIGKCRPEWYDGDLRDIIDRNIQRPLRAAGITQFSGRVVLWGIPDTAASTSDLPTGNGFAAMLDNNPEHIGTLAGVTASGSDIVNALAGDGPMYLMTTTSLEIIDVVSAGDQPFVPRIIAEPGFKATTNGCLYKDWFYGFNNGPLRTRARENIDVLFAAPVSEDMRAWDGARVMVNIDPRNEAVLYFFDDGVSTTVRPWMAQLSVWNPPINLSARVLDTQVVNGKLYVTYFDGVNTRVNAWEDGAGIGGTPFAATQYLDPNNLNSTRLKTLTPVGKLTTLHVFAVEPGAPVPDVSNTAAAAASFSLTDTTNQREQTVFTNLRGDAFAFRFDFGANGTFDKLVVGGLPMGARR